LDSALTFSGAHNVHIKKNKRLEVNVSKPPHVHVWPSIDDAKPREQGGAFARIGFNYQDEVAVSFLIDMLVDETILKVKLETHDDIVLTRSSAEQGDIAEFVQVKAAEINKLWSVADLCRQEDGPGTSIFELSLSRDEYAEMSRFRLVTLRPVVDELRMLTFAYGASGREPCGERYLELHNSIIERFPAVRSPKNNGAPYWLRHCHWDVRHNLAALVASNCNRLLRAASNENKPLLVEHIDLLLDDLRLWAKTAGMALWEPDRAIKIITRPQLRDWWEKRAAEIIDGVGSTSGGKLARKMRAATLAEDQVFMAIDLRRDYAKFIRTARYMEDDAARRLQSRVKSELASLRAQFVAGQILVDPVAFHALCVGRMNVINSERSAGVEDQAAFLMGCMYDIADRCLHQFTRQPA